MKNLRFLSIIALMLVGGLYLTSCNKDKDAQNDQQTEVQFAIQQTDFTNFKEYNPDEVPMCVDLSMDYVVFVIDDGTNETSYTSPVLNANGKLLTQAVKLATGDYTLVSFLVYHDNTPAGAGSEDVIVRAAPDPSGIYWDLMEYPLDIPFTVEAFKKQEILIDVLCYEDLWFQDFGFTWFEMNLVKIERICFFGDVCMYDAANYAGSDYELQATGLQADMPAIMKVEVYKGQDLIRTFMNDGEFHWDANANGPNEPGYLGHYGEGACMEVYWANDEDLTEEFTVILYVLYYDVANDNFDYHYVGEATFDDEFPSALIGPEGVVDFVVGNCGDGTAVFNVVNDPI